MATLQTIDKIRTGMNGDPQSVHYSAAYNGLEDDSTRAKTSHVYPDRVSVDYVDSPSNGPRLVSTPNTD